jgi:hypothetical protein
MQVHASRSLGKPFVWINQLTAPLPTNLPDNLSADSESFRQSIQTSYTVFMVSVLLRTVIRPADTLDHLRMSLHSIRTRISPRQQFLLGSGNFTRHHSTTIGLGSKIKGQSGRLYTLDTVLQRNQDILQTFYRAM